MAEYKGEKYRVIPFFEDGPGKNVVKHREELTKERRAYQKRNLSLAKREEN